MRLLVTVLIIWVFFSVAAAVITPPDMLLRMVATAGILFGGYTWPP